MISPIEVAFVTACTAFVSSTVGPMMTYRIGRAQIRASTVSSNRQRWIETLRDLIASFCSEMVAAAPIRRQILNVKGLLPSLDHDLLARVEEVTRTMMKIRLMTNPLEGDHHELVALLWETVSVLRDTQSDDDVETAIQIQVERIVVLSQSILKREWQRVKVGG